MSVPRVALHYSSQTTTPELLHISTTQQLQYNNLSCIIISSFPANLWLIDIINIDKCLLFFSRPSFFNHLQSHQSFSGEHLTHRRRRCSACAVERSRMGKWDGSPPKAPAVPRSAPRSAFRVPRGVWNEGRTAVYVNEISHGGGSGTSWCFG